MLFMKQDDLFTFSIETTPSLPTRYCRFLAHVLGWGLSYGNYMVAGIVWWQSDWFIAIGALLLGFVVFGIIRSKLHNDAIPPRSTGVFVQRLCHCDMVSLALSLFYFPLRGYSKRRIDG